MPGVSRVCVRQMFDFNSEISGAHLGTSFAAVADASNAGIVITNPDLPDNPIVYVNAAFERLTGYDKAEIIGRNCRFLQGKHTNPDAVDVLKQAVAERRSATVRVLNYRKSGQDFWNELTISPIEAENGTFSGFIGIQRDVTAEVATERALAEKSAALEMANRSLEEARSELMRLANFGPLTGLATRRFFDERLMHGLARAARTEEPLAVLMLNLDGFKPINERYGHSAGDKVLQVVASRLRVLVRECDTLARIRGDEFVLLMDTGVTRDALSTIVARIEREVQAPIVLGQDTVTARVSVGAALFPDDGERPADLVRVADTRMREVKRRRKGARFQARFVHGAAQAGTAAKL